MRASTLPLARHRAPTSTAATAADIITCRLSALISALDIVTASTLPLWRDTVRQTNGPPAHRGYRMFVHKGDSGGAGRYNKKQRGSGLMPVTTSPTLSYWCFIPGA